jgi:hypothetical protein
MATAVRDIFQVVREFAARLASYNGPPGEIVFNKDTLRLHAQNGRTPGGIPQVHAFRRPLVDASVILEPFDAFVGMTSLSRERTVFLPAAADFPQGHPLCVADESGACNAEAGLGIIVAAKGTDRIGTYSGPVASVTIGSPYQKLTFHSNGSNLWTYS